MASDGCYLASRVILVRPRGFVRVVKSISKGTGTKTLKERCDDSQAVDELGVLSCSVMVQG